MLNIEAEWNKLLNLPGLSYAFRNSTATLNLAERPKDAINFSNDYRLELAIDFDAAKVETLRVEFFSFAVPGELAQIIDGTKQAVVIKFDWPL